MRFMHVLFAFSNDVGSGKCDVTLSTLSLVRWICLPEVCDEHIIYNASGMILGLLVMSETLAIGHSIVKAQFFSSFKPQVVAA